MIQQTIFSYKLEIAKEVLTGRGGLALMAEFNHGIGLRELVNTHLPEPGSNRGYMPSVFVDPMVLMLQGGGRVLEDILVVKREAIREQDLFQKQEEEYIYHAVATNYEEEEKDAYSILKWHNERGTAENFNKELKIGFGKRP